jgi:hypothetical protein
VPKPTGVSFATVIRLGAKLPGVVESTSYGTPSLKAGKKMLVRLKEDGETLVVRMDMVSRDMVLRTEPKVFFITDHYKDYPAILVRLPKVSEARMKELLEDAWQLVASPRLRAERDG